MDMQKQELILETVGDFKDYELLDSGDGFILERWGAVRLVRPSPQAIWRRHLPQSDWESVHARYRPGTGSAAGAWAVTKTLPDPWTVAWHETKFYLKLTPFKHTGLFAEQAGQWEWMLEKSRIKNQSGKLKILNLFAYTGAASIVLTKSGHFVTHVDASKPAIAWAKRNQDLNKLPSDSIRWILDDAVKFVKRELKRGSRYDGILMDPPAFGHAPSGKIWKFNDDLPGLLADCVSLLTDAPGFVIINGYATNSSALAIANLLEDALGPRGGSLEFGELCLKQKDQRMLSTGIFARWTNMT